MTFGSRSRFLWKDFLETGSQTQQGIGIARRHLKSPWFRWLSPWVQILATAKCFFCWLFSSSSFFLLSSFLSKLCTLSIRNACCQVLQHEYLFAGEAEREESQKILAAPSVRRTWMKESVVECGGGGKNGLASVCLSIFGLNYVLLF